MAMTMSSGDSQRTRKCAKNMSCDALSEHTHSDMESISAVKCMYHDKTRKLQTSTQEFHAAFSTKWDQTKQSKVEKWQKNAGHSRQLRHSLMPHHTISSEKACT